MTDLICYKHEIEKKFTKIHKILQNLTRWFFQMITVHLHSHLLQSMSIVLFWIVLAILPSSHSGSPRQMYQLFQDSLAISQHCRKPDLFITMTANPNWPEVQEALLAFSGPDDNDPAHCRPKQTAIDHPDIVVHVFFQKMDALLKAIRGGLFRGISGLVYTVEFRYVAYLMCTFSSLSRSITRLGKLRMLTKLSLLSSQILKPIPCSMRQSQNACCMVPVVRDFPMPHAW